MAMKPSRLAAYAVFALLILIAAWVWSHYQDDEVTLTNSSGNETGILVDAQGSGGVLSDASFTSLTNTVDVKRLSAASSSNEVIGFTASRPVALKEHAPWTTGFDSVPLIFANEIEIPVTVWIVQLPKTMQAVHDLAAANCLLVENLWTAERMGVRFAPGGCEIVDVSVSSSVAFHDCSDRENFPRRFGHTAGRINIYVVDNVILSNSAAANGNGFTCDSDFIALGSATNGEVMIHELGHAFSLTHVDGLTDFDTENIMHSASNHRLYFTEGQLFRAHFTPAVTGEAGSALNTVYSSARAGQVTRYCLSTTVSDACPALQKRIWADGAKAPN